MAMPTIMYGSEAWILLQKDIFKINYFETKYFRGDRGCNLRGDIRNEDISKDLKVPSGTDRLKEYRINRKTSMERMVAVSYTHLDVYKRQLTPHG